MVREIGFDDEGGIEVSRTGLLIILLISLASFAVAGLSASLFSDIFFFHKDWTLKQLVVAIALPFFVFFGLIGTARTLRCFSAGKYVLTASLEGIKATWPQPVLIPWKNIKAIRKHTQTLRGRETYFLVIDRLDDKEGWMQKLFWHNKIYVSEQFMKGTVDAALEKLLAAQQRYGIKHI